MKLQLKGPRASRGEDSAARLRISTRAVAALRHRARALAVALGLSGCGGGEAAAPRTQPVDGGGLEGAHADAGARPPRGDASGAEAGVDLPPIELTYEPTLSALQREIFRPICAGPFCHKDARLGFDASSIERSYETLVGTVSDTALCGSTGLIRVVPGKPLESLLYLKLTEPPCGRKMPLLFDPNLPPRQLEQIRLWIERGALAD